MAALELLPGWLEFIAGGHFPAQKKLKLLEMAKNGDKRPARRTPIGAALANYTTNKSRSYDEGFDIEIRSLCPRWFVNTADEKRKNLLEMARSGEPRPASKRNTSYNVDFDNTIRSIRPDWFVRRGKPHAA